jgi:hypothetical protein
MEQGISIDEMARALELDSFRRGVSDAFKEQRMLQVDCNLRSTGRPKKK